MTAGSAFTEDDLLPISALQHLLFCERQCALIHLEGIWEENRLTAEGRHLHERVDGGADETRGPLRVARSLPLRSLELGLAGRADVVELRYDDAGTLTSATPIEYKRGRAKSDDSDAVQLCAQALCLEEMLGIRIEIGVLFYGTPRRRLDVALDEALRATTRDTVQRLRALIAGGITPRVARAPKCDNCSLLDQCLPEVTGGTSARRYLDRALSASLRDNDARPTSTAP